MANILEPIKKYKKLKKSAYDLRASLVTKNNFAGRMWPAGRELNSLVVDCPRPIRSASK